MRRLIIYFIRKRLGLKKYERFKYDNQKSDATYYFTEINIMKFENGYTEPSRVSLNWLLSDDCVVKPVM